MKVSTELKNLIKGEFENKREELSQKYIQLRKAEYNNTAKFIEEDEDFKELVNLAKKFHDKYKDSIPNTDGYRNSSTFYSAGTFKALADLKTNNIITFNSSYSYDENYKDDLKTLNKNEQTLLLTLQYQKDLDSVVDLLASYDIKL